MEETRIPGKNHRPVAVIDKLCHIELYQVHVGIYITLLVFLLLKCCLHLRIVFYKMLFRFRMILHRIGVFPIVFNDTSWPFPHSWFICRFVIRVTQRRMPLVEQKLLTLPEHLSSPPVLSRVHVARSLVFCVVFCRSFFVLLFFFFWPLCCLSFNLWILIIPLVSSNSSHSFIFI